MKCTRLTIGLLLVVMLTVARDVGAVDSEPAVAKENTSETTALATFAGGCFWCMEPPFDQVPGVISTMSGYIGGRVKNPTYEQVKTGLTKHYEALQVKYDPAQVTYEQLLSLFWHNVDPTQSNGQFCDKGGQYRTAIFYHDEEQKKLAESSKEAVTQELRKKVYTQIIEAPEFYVAEEYHQDYYTKNPYKYKYYRWNCGRDAQLAKVWGDKAGKP
jgi:peptide-methionine (S)-S-oxide reductase